MQPCSRFRLAAIDMPNNHLDLVIGTEYCGNYQAGHIFKLGPWVHVHAMVGLSILRRIQNTAEDRAECVKLARYPRNIKWRARCVSKANGRR